MVAHVVRHLVCSDFCLNPHRQGPSYRQCPLPIFDSGYFPQYTIALFPVQQCMDVSTHSYGPQVELRGGKCWRVRTRHAMQLESR
jgi:hypothetical protein